MTLPGAKMTAPEAQMTAPQEAEIPAPGVEMRVPEGEMKAQEAKMAAGLGLSCRSLTSRRDRSQAFRENHPEQSRSISSRKTSMPTSTLKTPRFEASHRMPKARNTSSP